MFDILINLVALVTCSWSDIKSGVVPRKTLYFFLGIAILYSLTGVTTITKYALIGLLALFYLYQNINGQIIGNADIIILMILFLTNSFVFVGSVIYITLILSLMCYFLNILKVKNEVRIIPLILIGYIISLLLHLVGSI